MLARVGEVLQDRLAEIGRLRSAVVAPVATITDTVLRQPDLTSALRALYMQLADLVRAEVGINPLCARPEKTEPGLNRGAVAGLGGCHFIQQ